MNEKLIISKRKGFRDYEAKTIKVSPEIHAKIKKIADDTLRSVPDITTLLVEYALKYTEIGDEY